MQDLILYVDFYGKIDTFANSFVFIYYFCIVISRQ